MRYAAIQGGGLKVSTFPYFVSIYKASPVEQTAFKIEYSGEMGLPKGELNVPLGDAIRLSNMLRALIAVEQSNGRDFLTIHNHA